MLGYHMTPSFSGKKSQQQKKKKIEKRREKHAHYIWLEDFVARHKTITSNKNKTTKIYVLHLKHF